MLLESRYTEAGSEVVVVPDSPVGRLGLSTCYDVRFPEMYARLVEQGAQVGRVKQHAWVCLASSASHQWSTTARHVLFTTTDIHNDNTPTQVLLVPSAFTVPTGTAHWEVLLRARAIESQCYVVAAAQAGRHNEKRESHGHAMVVDPWGKVLADAADASPSLITAEIGESSSSTRKAVVLASLCPLTTATSFPTRTDLGLIDDIRAKMPVRKHRRCDLFGGSAGAKY